MTKASGVRERRKGRRIFSVSREMSVTMTMMMMVMMMTMMMMTMMMMVMMMMVIGHGMGLGDRWGHGAGTWGGFRGPAWWIT